LIQLPLWLLLIYLAMAFVGGAVVGLATAVFLVAAGREPEG
jgi:hypothetical protein